MLTYFAIIFVKNISKLFEKTLNSFLDNPYHIMKISIYTSNKTSYDIVSVNLVK